MFNKIGIALVASLLMLGSCDQGPKKGVDGYKFYQKEYEQTVVAVNVVTYKTREELHAAAAKFLGEKDAKSYNAFSILFKNKPDQCVIHMMDPSVEYTPQHVGHEMLHCFYGQFHIDNETF